MDAVDIAENIVSNLMSLLDALQGRETLTSQGVAIVAWVILNPPGPLLQTWQAVSIWRLNPRIALPSKRQLRSFPTSCSEHMEPFISLAGYPTDGSPLPCRRLLAVSGSRPGSAVPNRSSMS